MRWLTLGCLLMGLLSPLPLLAGEAQPRYLTLRSDCLTLSLRPEVIDLVHAVPEPLTLPDGRTIYSISIRSGAQAWGLCYPSLEKRDRALEDILSRMDANGTK